MIPDEEANVHFRSQCATVCDEHGGIMADFVGHFENLEEDFPYVTQRIGVPELQLPHLLRSKTRGERSYSGFYDDGLAELVYDRYAEDVETFGYSFSREPADAPSEGSGPSAVNLAREQMTSDRRTEVLQRRIEKVEDELKAERRHSESLKKQKRRLKRRVRGLERQVRAMRSSRTWKATAMLRRIKPGVSRRR
jgi:hypothetical protein